jgi:hypothetical protein
MKYGIFPGSLQASGMPPRQEQVAAGRFAGGYLSTPSVSAGFSVGKQSVGVRKLSLYIAGDKAKKW